MSDLSKIRLVIPGRPQQWSRASRGQNGPSFTPSEVVKQMDRIYVEWEKAGSPRFPDDTPLMLHAAFLFNRPKSHYGTGKNAGVLKEGREFVEKIGNPDTDNHLKIIGDSLNGHAFDDDARITVMAGIKAYVSRQESERMVIVIQPSSFAWRRLMLGALDLDLVEGQA